MARNSLNKSSWFPDIVGDKCILSWRQWKCFSETFGRFRVEEVKINKKIMISKYYERTKHEKYSKLKETPECF